MRRHIFWHSKVYISVIITHTTHYKSCWTIFSLFSCAFNQQPTLPYSRKLPAVTHVLFFKLHAKWCHVDALLLDQFPQKSKCMYTTICFMASLGLGTIVWRHLWTSLNNLLVIADRPSQLAKARKGLDTALLVTTKSTDRLICQKLRKSKRRLSNSASGDSKIICGLRNLFESRTNNWSVKSFTKPSMCAFQWHLFILAQGEIFTYYLWWQPLDKHNLCCQRVAK